MLNLLRQSTAATISAGPMISDTDAAPETTLVPAIYVSKNGSKLALQNGTTPAEHDALGYYTVALDAVDVATCGRLRVVLAATGALSCWEDFMVVPGPVYDALISGTSWVFDGDSAGAPTTITITDSLDAGVPDCQVWVTLDAAGLNHITRVDTTSDQGEVVFLLQDGVTYYLWCDSPGGKVDILGQAFVAEND